jgi:ADP-heptose:LPS heptosyltransferase
MKNILILNFGTSHDVILSSNLISAMKNAHPNSNIEMLTLKTYFDTASNIIGLNKIHTIDSDLISTIMNNPLYSDGFAINNFSDSISTIAKVQWDTVVNYSNDNISSFLISALDVDNVNGVSIDGKGIARSSNKWSIFQNFVAPAYKKQTIGKADIRNHISDLPMFSGPEKIRLSEEYSVVAGQNFARIRQMNGSAATMVIGVNLSGGYDCFSLSHDTYVDIIEVLEESSDFKPVLLLNGKNYQREMVNKLNKIFDNKLISINIDTVALPSVLSNIDMIISTSNDQLAFADAMETKSIEVREFGTMSESSILTNDGNFSIFAKDEKYLASDIILSINEEFGTELPIDYMNSANPIYRTVKDDYGCFLTQTRGDINLQKELKYHVERSYFYQVLGYPKNQELIDHIKDNTDKEELLAFVSTLKSELTGTVKILLATLRSLKGMKNSEGSLNSFISYLDTLIRVGKEDSIVSSAIRFFEGRIENIDSEDIDSNIKAIENNLFELKSDLQFLTNTLTEFAEGNSIREEKSVSL